MPQTDITTWKAYQARYRETVVTIAGKDYALKYRAQEAVEIEKRSGKSLIAAILSGELNDSATILWAGLKHLDKKLGSPDAVVDILQKHLESDDSASCTPIFKAAARCVLASKLLGGPEEVNVTEFERLLGGDTEGKATENEAPSS
jgi:hypothetical protein